MTNFVYIQNNVLKMDIMKVIRCMIKRLLLLLQTIAINKVDVQLKISHIPIANVIYCLTQNVYPIEISYYSLYSPMRGFRIIIGANKYINKTA